MATKHPSQPADHTQTHTLIGWWRNEEDWGSWWDLGAGQWRGALPSEYSTDGHTDQWEKGVYVFSLLVGTLYPWAMWSTLLIRAVIVGLSPGPRWTLTSDLTVLEVNLFRLRWDNWNLRTPWQQILQLLKIQAKHTFCISQYQVSQ